MTTFATPAPAGEGINLKEYLGTLLLIEVHAHEQNIPTVHGDSSAIRADVTALDGAGKGNKYEDTLLFPKVLQSQLKRAIGLKVLGRLGQGTAKPGQSPPWVLSDPTEGDRATGMEFLAGGFAAPAATGAQAPF